LVQLSRGEEGGEKPGRSPRKEEKRGENQSQKSSKERVGVGFPAHKKKRRGGIVGRGEKKCSSLNPAQRSCHAVLAGDEGVLARNGDRRGERRRVKSALFADVGGRGLRGGRACFCRKREGEGLRGLLSFGRRNAP